MNAAWEIISKNIRYMNYCDVPAELKKFDLFFHKGFWYYKGFHMFRVFDDYLDDYQFDTNLFIDYIVGATKTFEIYWHDGRYYCRVYSAGTQILLCGWPTKLNPYTDRQTE